MSCYWCGDERCLDSCINGQEPVHNWERYRCPEHGLVVCVCGWLPKDEAPITAPKNASSPTPLSPPTPHDAESQGGVVSKVGNGDDCHIQLNPRCCCGHQLVEHGKTPDTREWYCVECDCSQWKHTSTMSGDEDPQGGSDG